MTILAGTSRGLFRFAEECAARPGEPGAEPVLHERGVREIVGIGSRLYAGTSTGLFVSDDDGMSWRNAGIEGCAVWQVRASRDGTLIYAAAEPAALFRSRDGGVSWEEVESFAAVPEAADWCVPVEPPMPGRARALIVDQENPGRAGHFTSAGTTIVNRAPPSKQFSAEIRPRSTASTPRALARPIPVPDRWRFAFPPR